MTLSEICDIVCKDPVEIDTWDGWKSRFKEYGVVVIDDDSGLDSKNILASSTARTAINRCTVKIINEEDGVITIPDLSVDEWRKEFTRLNNQPPVDQVLTAENGGPVKLYVELPPGKPPFIYSRAYLTNIVGVKPAWYLQGETSGQSYGWKVIILNKSRDEIIRNKGLDNDVIFVKALKIVKISDSKLSLLGEVAAW